VGMERTFCCTISYKLFACDDGQAWSRHRAIFAFNYVHCWKPYSFAFKRATFCFMCPWFLNCCTLTPSGRHPIRSQLQLHKKIPFHIPFAVHPFTVRDPTRWPSDTPLSAKVGTKFHRQVRSRSVGIDRLRTKGPRLCVYPCGTFFHV
jgi:hypothetical protein